MSIREASILSEKRELDEKEPDVEAKPVQHLTHTRAWWQRVPFTPTNPPPPNSSLDDALLIPEANAGIFSLLTFGWMNPLLGLGYARPLEAPDLWKLQTDRGAAEIAKLITESFDRRHKEATEYNKRLANGEIGPGLKGVWWSLTRRRAEKEREWRENSGKRKANLALAMNDSVKWWFWSAGLLKLVGDTAQVTSPLVMKEIIIFASESYYSHKLGGPVPSIGKGIGLTFVLLAMQVIGSLCTQHMFYRSATTGILLRGGLITAIYDRSLKLSTSARSTLTNGKLVNHISTDVSRIDFCAGFFHASWTAPIQLLVCLALLVKNLGPSALAGFAYFLASVPILGVLMRRYFALRVKTMGWTDKRAKLLQEVLSGMKVIKFFAWEVPFLRKISEYRRREVGYVRSLLFLRAVNTSVGISAPAMAAVIAFVVYSATGHNLNPAIIFTSLTFFVLLRLPLMFLPLSISAIADALNATRRLYDVFVADLLEENHTIDEQLDVALEVKGASFTWDAPPPADEKPGDKGKAHGGKKPSKSKTTPQIKVVPPQDGEKTEDKDDEVFMITDVNLSIPRGQLVAVVGPVGSGKSSLLQGLIGEMRKTAGSVVFGGSVAYCPQTAWIQNATIRENICFGRPFEEKRYWDAVRRSCLGPDLKVLPHGDMTEVGEKGISLSGGQKQRLNICRAVYCDTEILIFDDPLSALDAHVGKAVFQNVLLNGDSGKTRILVTHALHFLPQVDFIYVMDEGVVAEQGTYNDLIEHGDAFARFVKEFGSSEQVAVEEESAHPKKPTGVDEGDKKLKNATAGAALMQEEERNVGAVGGEVYKTYLKAGHGFILMPFLILSVIMMNVSSIISSYWLIWWQENKWHKPQGFYMGIYAVLGVSQAVAAYLVAANFALITYFSSKRLHKNAIDRIMHAPMSFFDTTPLGRIMNRFSKDIDTMDNLLADSMRMVVATSSMIFGAVILISVVLPWFLIGIVFIFIIYVYSAAFYRASARELKRLDAILRSSLYSHFSESLSGLATIRAYGETGRFRLDNEKRVDVENRAYWMTISNQHWLGVRLDFLGASMTFIVAMLAVGARFTISPGQTGLLLSYVMTVQQMFGWIVRQGAEVENNMNSVERVVHYAQSINQEAPYEVPKTKPPASWPPHGRIELKNVVLKYRPELPPVLKGISLTVNAGEKIGIVGRTGAGKSSMMTALARIVEPTSGSIILDGIDVSTIGLTDLRKNLAIILQDPLLFSGTMRTNLDPFNLHDDSKLWDALKRAHLVDSPVAIAPVTAHDDATLRSGTHTPVNKFDLDTVIEDEGNNLSVGQRSLVSLARALVKNCKVIILDEATASVDYETDHKIQDTIASEFKDCTILCIAHRLRTIIGYDRICVLDAGLVAEYDTPSNLYMKENGIFRGMCDQSSISLDDITHAERIAP